jgi:serine/threonine-protein kinase
MGSQRSPDGPLVAGYRLEERLAGGGGAEVHRARHVRTGSTVALKVLRDPRSLAPLERAMAVRHPNLVHILEAGTDPAGAYVVMEALEGVTLRDVLARRGPLDLPSALAVLLPVLDALHAAHALCLTHGDLKPENVFLERLDGGGARVKVLDLGGVPQGPDGEVVFGSAGYLSPEQAAGDVLDARSDVFGAALLLFELVTGRPPFEAPGSVATAYKIVHEPAPRVGDLRLQPVLDVALAKSPADRFPTAAAFADALAPLAPDAALSAAALSVLARP